MKMPNFPVHPWLQWEDSEKTKQRLMLRDYTEPKTSPGLKELAAGPQVEPTWRGQVAFRLMAPRPEEEATCSFPT